MKLQLNDGQVITIQSISGSADSLTICISEKISGITQAEMEVLFAKIFATESMTAEGVEAPYEKYTVFKSITKNIGGLFDILLLKQGETPEEKYQRLLEENEALKQTIATVQEENTSLKETVDMLEGCVLEMSEMVYQ